MLVLALSLLFFSFFYLMFVVVDLEEKKGAGSSHGQHQDSLDFCQKGHFEDKHVENGNDNENRG
jgi:hypothetical protein